MMQRSSLLDPSSESFLAATVIHILNSLREQVAVEFSSVQDQLQLLRGNGDILLQTHDGSQATDMISPARGNGGENQISSQPLPLLTESTSNASSSAQQSSGTNGEDIDTNEQLSGEVEEYEEVGPNLTGLVASDDDEQVEVYST
jgi:hypothetical protein